MPAAFRRFHALVRLSATETLGEPLSAVLFLAAFSLVHALPVFHYHRFGEPGRLARECAFSVLLVFGLTFAVCAAGRAIRREFESGTAAAALARDVSRGGFFVAKTCGVLVVFALFAVAVLFAGSLAGESSWIGSLQSANDGAAHVWGPGFACGVALTLLAFALAAAANRFCGMRFCLSACLLMALAQPVAWGLSACLLRAWPVADATPAHVLCRPFAWAPALTALVFGCAPLVALSAAASLRLKAALSGAVAVAAVVVAFVWPVRAVLPDLNAFWLVDALAGGGAVGWSAVRPMLGAGVCLTALWLGIGAALAAGKDVA